jgi:hypothetical protein
MIKVEDETVSLTAVDTGMVEEVCEDSLVILRTHSTAASVSFL